MASRGTGSNFVSLPLLLKISVIYPSFLSLSEKSLLEVKQRSNFNKTEIGHSMIIASWFSTQCHFLFTPLPLLLPGHPNCLILLRTRHEAGVQERKQPAPLHVHGSNAWFRLLFFSGLSQTSLLMPLVANNKRADYNECVKAWMNHDVICNLKKANYEKIFFKILEKYFESTLKYKILVWKLTFNSFL